jgi:hypothetical protein
MKPPKLTSNQKDKVLGDPPPTNNEQPSTHQTFDEWAKVELFGHQVIVGRVTEATLAGGSFIRVDVPAVNGNPAFTRFFGPSAIYSITPVSEQIARDLLQVYRKEPVSRYELSQLPAPSDDSDA